MSKKCRKCHQVKPRTAFHINKDSKDGLYAWCKICKHKRVIELSRLRNSNCSQELYDSLYDNQNGCCCICKIHSSKLTKALSADHCHSTNNVRGLLCGKCNTALGLLNDDVKLLKEAISYLERSNNED